MMDLDWKNEMIKPIDARKKIAVWALEAWKWIPVDVVWNSWRHNPFSWFPDKPVRPTTFEDEEEDEGDDELSITSV